MPRWLSSDVTDRVELHGFCHAWQKPSGSWRCLRPHPILEGQLKSNDKESNAEVISLYEQSGSHDHLTTLSLCEELSILDGNVCSTKSHDTRFSKLSNLIKQKSKALRKTKSAKLNLHPEKVKMAELVKDLEFDLQSRTDDLRSDPEISRHV